MQAQAGFLEGGGTFQALSKVWKAEGIKGLYRRCTHAHTHTRAFAEVICSVL